MKPDLVQPPQQLGRAQERLFSLAFWGLAVITLLNLQHLYLWGAPGVKLGGFLAALGCCLLLLGRAAMGRRRWPGTPGALLIAALASYIVLGAGAWFAAGLERAADFDRDVLRQTFFLIVAVAALSGGRALLERAGAEALLRGALALLTGSCIVVLTSPLLRDLGVVWPYVFTYRWPGAFIESNEAGFIGCMTASLALAFLGQVPEQGAARACRQRRLAWLGLVAGGGAIAASISITACVVFAAIWLFHLWAKGVRGRRLALQWALVASLLAAFVYLAEPVRKIRTYAEANIGADYRMTCPQPLGDNPGLASDCAMLLAARDDLDGAGLLNWAASTPVASWHGIGLRGEPPRIVALDLSRMGLNGRLSPELGGLDQLAQLRLGRNQLAGPIPPELGKLTRLRRLDLRDNALTGDIPPALWRLPRLRELELADNRLTGALPAEAQTRDFITLLLGGNDLSGPVADINNFRNGALQSMRKRLFVWSLGMDKFLDSPLIGNGIGRLRRSMEGAPTDRVGNPTEIHNVYLMLAGEAGLAPLLLYLLFLYSLLRLQWTAPRSLARDAAASWALVMALYGVTFHHFTVLGAFMFLAGLCCALGAASAGASRPRRQEAAS